MHDLLPQEEKLLAELEKKILNLFRAWSYHKVTTPTLEYGACVQPDIDSGESLFKFFDRHGHVLVLRPELTTPIARLVSTRLRGCPLPLRLCYSADVFRDTLRGPKEFRQAGVELVGSASELADAEVIALAVHGIKVLGFKDFQFNVGHMGIFTGLMEELGVSPELRARLEEAIAKKDMVGIERLARESDLPEEAQRVLIEFPRLHGKEEILDRVLSWSDKEAVTQGVNSLRRIFDYLEQFGVIEHVDLDLGMLRGFTYYTGAIFEGYVPGVGFPVVEGGRYDALYEDFGYPLPATGFAINLGSLLSLFPLPAVESADVFLYGEKEEEVIKAAQALRADGRRVEMALAPLTDAEARDHARARGIPRVGKVRAGEILWE